MEDRGRSERGLWPRALQALGGLAAGLVFVPTGWTVLSWVLPLSNTVPLAGLCLAVGLASALSACAPRRYQTLSIAFTVTSFIVAALLCLCLVYGPGGKD